MQEDIKCPICGKSCQDLMPHLKVHKIYTKEELYKIYPNYGGLLKIIKPLKYVDLECEICGKKYNLKNALVNHARLNHLEYFEKIKEKDERKNANYICPVCGKKFNCIKQHVERTHRMQWEEFCNEYKWDKSKTNCITEDYRKHLSENKIKFYRTTERGKELRKEQSLKYSENNPSKDRKKMEKIIFSRTYNNSIPQSKRGVKVHYDGKTFRSFSEFVFYSICKHFNVKLEFEPNRFIVKYYNSEKKFITTYLPDFYNEQFGIIELKDTDKTVNLQKDDEKYVKVKKIYNAKQIDFNILSVDSALKLFSINLLNFEKIEILRKIIDDAIEKREITFMCRNNSATVKMYLGENFNNEQIVKIIN